MFRPQEVKKGKQRFFLVGLDQFLGHLEKRGFLEVGLVTDLRRIKDHGDVIAHLAEGPWDFFEPKPKREPRLWVEKEEARDDLIDVATFLKVLWDVIETRPELMGPPEKW